MGADPFELALAELEGGGSDPFEAALAEVEGGSSPLRTAVLSAADSAPFAKQIGAGMRTAVQFAQDPFSIDIVETYRAERDAITAGLEADQAANPGASTAGTVAGFGAQLATGGVNPVSVAKGLATGARALLTREGAKAAGRSLLTREAAETAGTGAALGAAYGLSESEADLTRGEFAEAAVDTAEGALVGTGAALGGRALLAAAPAGVAARTAVAEEKVATAVAAERDSALRLAGLEGKQRTLGGPARAKARAQALYDEPLPGDPSKRLLAEADKLNPDERLVLATQLRQQTGAQLGAIRDELAKVPDAGVSAGAVREQFRGAFAELPTEVQAKALEQVDGMIGALAKDGQLAPAALRKLIEDTEGLAKFGTPNLEAALGNARARVFQSARGVLVQNERDLIAKALPERAEEYGEALRKYGVYSDFELGSKVILERANKGQKLIKQPQREDQPGVGRQLLRLAAGEAGARVGALLPVPGAAYGTGRAAEALVERFTRWTGPDVGQLSAKVQKLERLRPMMEEALQKGPAEVARVHALFMARSPDYRKAIESEE